MPAVSYPGVDGALIAERYDILCDRLKDMSYRCDPSLYHCRQELLEIEGLRHAMWFRTDRRWDVSLLDIGYVEDEKFVFLCNVREISSENVPIQKGPAVTTKPRSSVTSLAGDVFR